MLNCRLFSWFPDVECVGGCKVLGRRFPDVEWFGDLEMLRRCLVSVLCIEIFSWWWWYIYVHVCVCLNSFWEIRSSVETSYRYRECWDSKLKCTPNCVRRRSSPVRGHMRTQSIANVYVMLSYYDNIVTRSLYWCHPLLLVALFSVCLLCLI